MLRIDDMHGFAVIFVRVRIHTQKRKNIFFITHTQKKHLRKGVLFLLYSPYGELYCFAVIFG